jgi:DNA-binding transcriptional LysR family regulator
MSMPHFLAIPRLVSMTDLIIAAPRKLALVLAAQYPLRIVKPPVAIPEFTISMLWHERTNADPAQQWIRNMLSRIAKAL